jgi:hypothetical protein
VTTADAAVYVAAAAVGDTDPRGLKALRLAAIELALEDGASVAQSVFSGAYAAGCHRQFLAKAGSSPADRRPFFDAQTIGDPMITAAWIVLGEPGGLAVERWVIDRSRWPLIVARAEPIYDSEAIADSSLDVAAESLRTVTTELALEATATLAQAITAANYAVHVHAAHTPVGRLHFQAAILGDRLAVAAMEEAGPRAYADAERWVTAEQRRISAEAAILRQAHLIDQTTHGARARSDGTA